MKRYWAVEMWSSAGFVSLEVFDLALEARAMERKGKKFHYKVYMWSL